MNTDVMFSKQSDEWATPQALYDKLDEEFHFELDAAASPGNAKTLPFFSRDDNALICGWATAERGRRVWLNPPYSQCAAFIEKAAAEAANGCTVVCLVPSRTDTRWWHRWVWDKEQHQARPGVEIRFLQGRLKFGDSKNSAPFPSVVIVFRSMEQA